MTKTRTDEELFDLLLLGLTWVQENVRTRPGWTGNGILHTLKFCGAVNEAQYHLIARSPSGSLRKYAVAHSVCVWPDQKRRINTILKTSDMLTVVLIDSVMLASDRIFLPRGYRLLATDKGRARAHKVATSYARELPHDMFMGQWKSHRQQMNGMFAATSALRDK